MVSDLLIICSGYCKKCIGKYVIFLKLNFLQDTKGMDCYIMLCWESRDFCRDLISEISFVAAQRRGSDKDVVDVCINHQPSISVVQCYSILLVAGSFMLKRVGDVRAYLLSLPANITMMNNEILMMSKLWPGKSDNLTSLS